jgi:hypothetical protein
MTWQLIHTVPFGPGLELVVIEDGAVQALVFPCRRSIDGWIDARTGILVAVRPTHWRL